MLGKMIKYDLLFGFKKYMFMTALTAALLITALIARAFDNDFINGLFTGFAVIASVAFFVLFVVISVQHLYTQLCSRESYLSYTLPVSPHTLLLSKLITISLWFVYMSALLLLFWGLAVFQMVLYESGMSFSSLIDIIRQQFEMAGGTNFTQIAVLFTAFILLSTISNLPMISWCVSLANVPALKERGLGVAAGIVSYIALNSSVGFIPIAIFALKEKISGHSFVSTELFSDGMVLVSDFLWIYILFSIAATAGFYALTIITMKKQRSI